MTRFRSVYDPGNAAITAKFPITAPDIATDAVTGPKILADAVTTAKLANDAVTSPKAATGVVDGDTITGSVFQTSTPGVGHTTIMLDGPNTQMKFYSGLSGETPSDINPVGAGSMALLFRSGVTATLTNRATLQLTSDTAGAGSTFGVQAGTISLSGIGSGAGMDSWQVACSSDAAPTSTTNVTISGLSQAVTSPGTSAVYIVTIDALVLVQSSQENILELLADGSIQTAQLITTGGTSAMRVAGHQTWRVTGMAAGSRTFTARTRSAGAYTTTVYATHTQMTVERRA